LKGDSSSARSSPRPLDWVASNGFMVGPS
jgi:hypothetical protein